MPVITIWVQSSSETSVDERWVEDFNEANDDVQVEYRSMPSDRFANDLMLAMRTDEGPDIFHGPSPAEVVNPGFALPLDDYLSDETRQEFDGYLEGSFDYIIQDSIYALPYKFNGTRLLINRDLFEEAGLGPDSPPQTFSEVEEAAAAITESSGGDAYGFAVPLAWNGVFQNHIEPLAMAVNPNLTRVGLFDRERQEFAMEEFEPILQLYRDLQADGSMFPSVGTLDRDSLRSEFANGQVGMYVGSSLEVGVMNDALETDVDWDAVRLPVPDGMEYQRSSGTVVAGGFVSSQTEDPELAVRVYEEWLSADRTCELVKEGHIIPVLDSLQECVPTDIHGYEQFVPSDDLLDTPDPIAPGNALRISGTPYEEIIAELAVTDTELAPALQELSARYTEAYQEGVQSGELDASDYS
ncbi:ABC transporter substrate-binding protein [Ruania albidiflava]|uniref:ABC transporter substrate-binding protein n=1 Tax=Ruania albidiflava TaxID=366586 RepID=UPI0023F07CD1|nr:extracellular solute-binding protein [Ruania albidiflava]